MEKNKDKNGRQAKKIVFAGKVYTVHNTKELTAGLIAYEIEDEPGHFDWITNPDKILDGGCYGIKNKGLEYPTKAAVFDQDEPNPILAWVEENYKRLAAPVGKLTEAGRGYLIALGDIIRKFDSAQGGPTSPEQVDADEKSDIPANWEKVFGSEWRRYMKSRKDDLSGRMVTVNMIQWIGNNLKEVIDFTGKSPRFGEWFNSWEEYENYVHSHNNILKLFCEDGSHYEVPVGAWIVKTPDGYNVPSVAKYVKQERPKVDLGKELEEYFSGWADSPDYGQALNSDGECVSTDEVIALARHFYELGLNARKV